MLFDGRIAILRGKFGGFAVKLGGLCFLPVAIRLISLGKTDVDQPSIKHIGFHVKNGLRFEVVST